MMTDWPHYRDVDPASWGTGNGRTVIDTRLCLNAATWADTGWQYLTMAH